MDSVINNFSKFADFAAKINEVYILLFSMQNVEESAKT